MNVLKYLLVKNYKNIVGGSGSGSGSGDEELGAPPSQPPSLFRQTSIEHSTDYFKKSRGYREERKKEYREERKKEYVIRENERDWLNKISEPSGFNVDVFPTPLFWVVKRFARDNFNRNWTEQIIDYYMNKGSYRFYETNINEETAYGMACSSKNQTLIDIFKNKFPPIERVETLKMKNNYAYRRVGPYGLFKSIVNDDLKTIEEQLKAYYWLSNEDLDASMATDFTFVNADNEILRPLHLAVYYAVQHGNTRILNELLKYKQYLDVPSIPTGITPWGILEFYSSINISRKPAESHDTLFIDGSQGSDVVSDAEYAFIQTIKTRFLDMYRKNDKKYKFNVDNICNNTARSSMQTLRSLLHIARRVPDDPCITVPLPLFYEQYIQCKINSYLMTQTPQTINRFRIIYENANRLTDESSTSIPMD